MLNAALNEAKTPHGLALPDVVRRQIWRYFLTPTAINWDAIHVVIIATTTSGRLVTIGAALALVDPFYAGASGGGVNRHETGYPHDPTELPTTAEDRWPIVPNRFMVARAIQEAIRANRR